MPQTKNTKGIYSVISYYRLAGMPREKDSPCQGSKKLGHYQPGQPSETKHRQAIK